MARALLRAPAIAKPGEVVEVRILLQHPMETGFRPGADGQVQPRDIVQRVEARYAGEVVFAADLFPSIAANPYLAFTMRVPASGTLSVSFSGDNGFAHTESAQITVA